MANWALIGAGFISQRHIQAIQDIGDKLLMVCDIDKTKREKVPDAKFFNDYIHMSKHPDFEKIDWVSICTPNYLHFPMMMTLLKMGKNVLCEKPLVIKAKDITTLSLLTKHSQLYTVLQLRHNPELQELKSNIRNDVHYEGNMTLNLHRGGFYKEGWKGDVSKSGGLLFNIGVHYFDLLIWLFGEPIDWEVYELNPGNANGKLKFNNADIIWSLSIEAPMDNQLRRLKLNDINIDLTRHFEDLHTKVFRDAKIGKGVTFEEAGRVIKVLENIINNKK